VQGTPPIQNLTCYRARGYTAGQSWRCALRPRRFAESGRSESAGRGCV